jgi:endo-alpha-1,4-polygalactosaminidase (GH114 family)
MESLGSETKFCIRKLTKATQAAFTNRLIMPNENEELFQQNHKTVSKSAKETVVGKAEMMKYEGIIEARRLREEKELKKQAAPSSLRILRARTRAKPAKRKTLCMRLHH